MAAAFQRTAARDPGAVAVATPDGSVSITWAEYADQVRGLTGALYAHGVRRGDPVALMMLNRPEFYPIATAALHLGAVPFPLYPGSTVQQVRWVLESAAPSVVFCDSEHAQTVLAAVAPAGGDGNVTGSGGTVRHVVLVGSAATKNTTMGDGSLDEPGHEAGDDPGDEPARVTHLAGFVAIQEPGFDFEAAWRAVDADDVLTLIYTSGTTGEPKVVEITHGNMLAQVAATDLHLHAGPGDRVLSFLPAAHIADRWAAHYLQITCGTTVYPLSDRTRLLTALLQVRPTLFGAVPQIWQKVRAGVTAMVDAEPDEQRRAGVRAAMEIGVEWVRAREDGTTTPELEQRFATVDATVFAAIRTRLGLDRARIVMSGAAPVPTDVVVFFNALGIPLIDGWGMSELSCMGAFTPADAPRLGSVGKAIAGLETRVDGNGELWVRGPTVMRGYRNRPDLTGETVDADGWLRTGDIVRIDDDGYLYVVDRLKEIMVNTSGKNLSPAGIEGRLKAASPLIGQAVTIADARPFVTALIVLDPDPDVAAQSAATSGVQPDPAALADDERVVAAVRAAVDQANAAVAPVEQIRKFAVLPEFWLPGSDVLTHTMKLRRKPIHERYRHLVDALYRLPRDVDTLRVDGVSPLLVPPSVTAPAPLPATGGTP